MPDQPDTAARILAAVETALGDQLTPTARTEALDNIRRILGRLDDRPVDAAPIRLRDIDDCRNCGEPEASINHPGQAALDAGAPGHLYSPPVDDIRSAATPSPKAPQSRDAEPAPDAADAEAWRTDPRERLLTAIDRTWAWGELGMEPEQLVNDYAATVRAEAAGCDCDATFPDPCEATAVGTSGGSTNAPAPAAATPSPKAPQSQDAEADEDPDGLRAQIHRLLNWDGEFVGCPSSTTDRIMRLVLDHMVHVTGELRTHAAALNRAVEQVQAERLRARVAELEARDTPSWRHAAALHQQKLLTTAELYAVIQAALNQPKDTQP